MNFDMLQSLTGDILDTKFYEFMENKQDRKIM